jgi:hypothetical protein
LNDRTAACHYFDSLQNRFCAARRFEHDVEVSSFQRFFITRDIYHAVSADRLRDRQRSVEDIGSGYGMRPGETRSGHRQDPDRPCSCDENLFAKQWAGLTDGVKRDCQRLCESRFGRGRLSLHRKNLGGVTNDILAKPALHMGKAHGAAIEAHVEAEVPLAEKTKMAHSAGVTGVDGDDLAEEMPVDITAHLYNQSGEFMPQDQWFAYPCGPEPPMLVIVQVRSANAPRLNLDLHIMGSNGLLGNIIDPQIERRVNDNSFHIQSKLQMNARLEATRYAAIDIEDVTGDEARPWGCEKHCGSSQLGSVTPPTKGRSLL